MLVSKLQRKIKRFGALMTVGGVIAASLLVPAMASAVPLGGEEQVAPVNSPTKLQEPGTPSIKPTVGDCRAPYGQLNSTNCGIIKYVVMLTNILSALVGVIIVISIVWAGIQYSMAQSDPQAVMEARKRIRNAVLALAVYIFMVAFLQWVVPGGVF